MMKNLTAILNQHKRLFLISILTIVVLGASVSGIFYYQTGIAPFKRTVLTVDDTSVTMDYLIKRAKWANSDVSAMLQQLTYEQVVKIMAPSYEISVSDAQVNEQMRYEAAYIKESEPGSSTEVSADDVTDSEFEEWYSDTLKTSGLSAIEFKDIIRTNLLAAGMQTYLETLIPTESEQVHLFVIVLGTDSETNDVINRIAAGEDFAAIASEISLDQSKENNGDLGWVPRGVTPYDDIIFGLEIGSVSEPVQLNSGQFALFLVSEKSANRQIDDLPLQTLKSRALYVWLTQEVPKHKITTNLDDKTLAWVNSRLVKTSK
jgi:parvulin-like peptidyl-prolyl isomerase